MKYWNIRVIEADSQAEAIQAVEDGDFYESDILCDKVIPEMGFSEISEPFHCFDIEAVAIDDDGYIQIVDEEKAEFWSVYVRLMDDEARCIADLPSKALAIQFVKSVSSLIRNYNGKAVS